MAKLLKLLKLSVRDYESLSRDFAGVCLACGKLDEDAQIEPDARGIECPSCNKKKVVGLEEALLYGRVVVK